MADHITEHFQIHVPDFAASPWHAGVQDAFDRVDAILYGLAAVAGAPLWVNSHNYVVGNLVQDDVSGALYMCNTSHTSAAAPITFQDDRAEGHPFWTLIVATV